VIENPQHRETGNPGRERLVGEIGNAPTPEEISLLAELEDLLTKRAFRKSREFDLVERKMILMLVVVVTVAAIVGLVSHSVDTRVTAGAIGGFGTLLALLLRFGPRSQPSTPPWRESRSMTD
jgi:hypothetical protein